MSGTGATKRRPQNDSLARGNKRGRYAPKACTDCQSRKIRCEGGVPCLQCKARGRECMAGPARARVTGDLSSYGRENLTERDTAIPSCTPQTQIKVRITTNELLRRLIDVEQQVNAVLNSGAHNQHLQDDIQHQSPDQPGYMHRDSSVDTVIDKDDGGRQTFVGEMSFYGLEKAGLQLDDLTAKHSNTDGVSHARPLTPKPHSFEKQFPHSHNRKNSNSWLRDMLSSYGVVAESLDCRSLLQTFFDEIHILYPFLHPPSIWQTYECLWKHSLFLTLDELQSCGQSQLSVSLLFTCLALGRCTTSSRIDNVDGACSAGWSLYSVAAACMRSVVDMFSDSPISLEGLQVFALMVVYLFRLDGAEKAERILAYAISSAHILGLHRESFYTELGIFEDEMSRRVWWSMYVLDRRLFLESGRPFLIQDANVETRSHRNLSDAWLTKYRSCTKTAAELTVEIEAETSSAHGTVLPYLEAYISQSRIVTDVWKVVYTTPQSSADAMGMVHDYLDFSLDKWWQDLPPSLKYSDSVSLEEQFPDLAWWQVKQALSLHLRYLSLKLLIRKPFATGTDTPTARHNHISNDANCAQRAASVIRIFEGVPKTHLKYAFVFMHPVISATMILYGILFRNPGLRAMHGNTLLFAVRSLLLYCRMTWVSSRMIRLVARLNGLVQCDYNQSTAKNVNLGQNSEGLPPSGGIEDGRWSRLQAGPAVTKSKPPLAENRPMQFTNISNSSVEQANQEISLNARMGLDLVPERDSQSPQSAHDSTILGNPSIYSQSSASNAIFGALPSWSTTDFDFERTFNERGSGNPYTYTNIDAFDFDAEWLQSFRDLS